jgi:hypothetical protein
MLAQVISLILGLLFGGSSLRQRSEPEFFANATLEHLRKIALLASGVAIGLVMFLGGFMTILLDMILTTRSENHLSLSQASIVGSALVLISFLLQGVLFSRRFWQLPVAPPAPMEQSSFQPIAEALAGLIQEYTLERRAATATAPPPATANPAYN